MFLSPERVTKSSRVLDSPAGNKYGQYLAAIQIAREEKAKNAGKKYAPDKTKKDWQFAADYDENIAAKADASAVAAERKKDPIAEGSWLGGGKKRKSRTCLLSK